MSDQASRTEKKWCKKCSLWHVGPVTGWMCFRDNFRLRAKAILDDAFHEYADASYLDILASAFVSAAEAAGDESTTDT